MFDLPQLQLQVQIFLLQPQHFKRLPLTVATFQLNHLTFIWVDLYLPIQSHIVPLALTQLNRLSSYSCILFAIVSTEKVTVFDTFVFQSVLLLTLDKLFTFARSLRLRLLYMRVHLVLLKELLLLFILVHIEEQFFVYIPRVVSWKSLIASQVKWYKTCIAFEHESEFFDPFSFYLIITEIYTFSPGISFQEGSQVSHWFVI